MSTPQLVLAQFNVTRFKAPLDVPEMREFTDFLAPVNQLAEHTPGFIWRLVAPDGQSSSYLAPAYDDPMIAVNMSVWQDIDALRNFVYQTVHVYFLRNRKKWVDQVSETQAVLWWVPQGHFPTAQEGKEKLQMLQEHGPCPDAFTFQKPFGRDGKAIKTDQR